MIELQRHNLRNAARTTLEAARLCREVAQDLSVDAFIRGELSQHAMQLILVSERIHAIEVRERISNIGGIDRAGLRGWI